jgi:hypothetical protein
MVEPRIGSVEDVRSLADYEEKDGWLSVALTLRAFADVVEAAQQQIDTCPERVKAAVERIPLCEEVK